MKVLASLFLATSIASVSTASPSTQAEFKFKNVGTETNPKATVWLMVGSKRTKIMNISGTPVTDSLISDISWIPAGAVSSLQSWWAGGGDQMYVLKKGHSYRVYHRPLDEQSKTGKFHLVKTIKG